MNIVRARRFDVCVLQREMMSTFCTLEPLTRRPRILDVDDAIFVHRGGRAARKLAALADWVVCGNQYLADWFGTISDRVVVIPTAVDTERFVPVGESRSRREKIVVGWVGTSSHLADLVSIEPALRVVLAARDNAVFRVICDQAPNLTDIPRGRWEFIRWSGAREVENIQSLDIGIMPLRENEFTRGKCSFKMLQYMACGLPVVVSPIGMNRDVLALGQVGYGANRISEWTEALVSLIDNLDAAASLGTAGRKVVLAHFATNVIVHKLAAVIRNAVV
jgi:glycosyltransferase involved in cell wall biosynthesis